MTDDVRSDSLRCHAATDNDHDNVSIVHAYVYVSAALLKVLNHHVHVDDDHRACANDHVPFLYEDVRVRVFHLCATRHQLLLGSQRAKIEAKCLSRKELAIPLCQ